jgi:hypothetical protein
MAIFMVTVLLLKVISRSGSSESSEEVEPRASRKLIRHSKLKKEVIYPGEPRLDEGKRSLGEPTGGAWMFIAEKQEPEGI